MSKINIPLDKEDSHTISHMIESYCREDPGCVFCGEKRHGDYFVFQKDGQVKTGIEFVLKSKEGHDPHIILDKAIEKARQWVYNVSMCI